MAATTPITSLLPGTVFASSDVLPFVDVSDHTQSPQGSTLKTTLTSFFAGIPVPVVVTSASANALAVGLTGATNPAFAVDASTALQVAGLKVTGAVTGGTVAVQVADSGLNANLSLNAKGTGTIAIGSASTGRVTITPPLTAAGTLDVTGQLSVTGTIVSTKDGTILTRSGVSTTAQSIHFSNTSGAIEVGVESSVGSVIITGASAYDAVVRGKSNISFSADDGVSLSMRLTTAALTLSSAVFASASTSSHTLGPISFTNGAIGGATTGAFSTSVTISGASAVALSVGLGGATNPAFQVDSSTALQAAGLRVTGAVAAGTVAVAVISSGAAATLAVDAKGSGMIKIGSNSTGDTQIGASTLISQAGLATFQAAEQVIAGNAALATSANQYGQLANAGGVIQWGVNRATANGMFSGSTAYAAGIGSTGATSLELATNNTVRMGIVGVAGTPANSNVGNIYIVNTSAPTGNPTGMGYLWVEAGALKFRGTSGTVTTVAPA